MTFVPSHFDLLAAGGMMPSMSMPGKPKAAAHHEYRSWSTSWYDSAGKRHCKRFGKVGETPKAVAVAAYERWLGQWKHNHELRDGTAGDSFTIRKLCLLYAEECRTLYTKRGKLTSTIPIVEAALNALMEAHADRPADAIGAPEIHALIDGMTDTKDRHGEPRKLTASTLNGRLGIIKRAFKWARIKGFISREAAIDVCMTPNVRTDRGRAKPGRIVKPVPQDVIDKTLEAAPRTVADMINVQMLTGMRPGELCDMRPCDLQKIGRDLIYTPWRHKTEHKKKVRVIVIGPKAQAILKPYIDKRKLTEHLFLPADAHRERLEMIGFEEVTAYQMARSTFKPGRAYTNGTYRNAVNRAADRAIGFYPHKVVKAGGRPDYSHRWHPHRLRHNFATLAREHGGIEATAALLGHSSPTTTEMYAEQTLTKGKKIVRKVG